VTDVAVSMVWERSHALTATLPAMDVAIVGGTGAEGFGLALRLAKAGHHVTIGSRMPEKAALSVTDAKDVLGTEAPVDGAVNADSVVAKPVVFVTVPFAGQAMIYEAIKDALEPDTIVCDCTSPLMTAVGGRASHAIRPWHGSAAEFAKSILPKNVRLVAAFHTVGAEGLKELDSPVDSDALVMGDDAEAKAAIGGLIEDVEGMRWVDCGGLQMARIAETLTALLISINVRYKIHDAGFRVTGRENWGDPRA
jgi:8-hydroxy-5-deazaflavin:NADPH oxidoreductase